MLGRDLPTLMFFEYQGKCLRKRCFLMRNFDITYNSLFCFKYIYFSGTKKVSLPSVHSLKMLYLFLCDCLALETPEQAFAHVPVTSEAAVRSSHCKKRLPIFPSPAGMSITKISLAGNN
jgi:hypothetical protein